MTQKKPGGQPGPKPGAWRSGPNPLHHQQYVVWNQCRAQALFLDQDWQLPWPQWREIWAPHWNQRGRHRDDLCMVRTDIEGAWSADNVEIVTRSEHYRRQRLRQLGML